MRCKAAKHWQDDSTVIILTLWVWWHCLRDSKGSRMETRSLPVWSPDLPQWSGLSAQQRSRTVTGPKLPEEHSTHTHTKGYKRWWCIVGEKLYSELKAPLFWNNILGWRETHSSGRWKHEPLPLGRCRIWRPRRSEPGVRRCWSQRSCRSPLGWRERGADETRETGIPHAGYAKPWRNSKSRQ